jgi:ADP-ribose pyrophosphatase YjhB (NUDIX family)
MKPDSLHPHARNRIVRDISHPFFPLPIVKFCPDCGASVARQMPAGDNRERDVCTACGAVHYRNPRLVLGTIPIWGEQVLLCRRAIEPRHGYWTLPAGFMEVGESMQEGASRETLEEAGARVELGPVFTMLDVPHVEQVHVFYRARLLDLDFEAGPESLEVRLFHEADIPWEDLAFRTVSRTLRLFFAARAEGSFDLHTGVVHHPPKMAAEA